MRLRVKVMMTVNLKIMVKARISVRSGPGSECSQGRSVKVNEGTSVRKRREGLSHRGSERGWILEARVSMNAR